MPKVGIDLIDYETQLDHLTWSEARVAVDATRSMDETRAIFYGEQWGALSRLWNQEIWPHYIEGFRIDVKPIWDNLIPTPMPDFVYHQWGEDGWETPLPGEILADDVFKTLAKHILDEVYDVETDGE